jgi:hypothetical protein
MIDFIEKIIDKIFNFMEYAFSTKKRKLISIGVILTLFVGAVYGNIHYENTRLKHGEVYDKQYDPPSTTWTYINERMTPVHNAAKWVIKYRVYEDETGKFRRGSQEVDETTYHKYTIGDYVDFRNGVQ